MSNLYTVLYSQTRGIDRKEQSDLLFKGLCEKVKLIPSRIEETKTVLHRKSEIIENVINVLDDLEIPVYYIWNPTAGVYMGACFLLKGNHRENKEILSALKGK